MIERMEHCRLELLHVFLADQSLHGMPISSPDVDICMALEDMFPKVVFGVHFFGADPAIVYSIIV
jgi:hypothetical protein